MTCARANQSRARCRCGHPGSNASSVRGETSRGEPIGAWLARRHQHELLVEHCARLEPRIGDRLGDERGVELAVQHQRGELLRIAGAQFHGEIGMLAMQPVERLRQPDRGGAFHCAQAQRPARVRVAHGVARFFGERQQPVGVVDEHAALGGELHPPALADEERDAEIGLELLHPGGHIGLHAVKLLRGARDAAGAHHCAKDAEIGKLHRCPPYASRIENNTLQ